MVAHSTDLDFQEAARCIQEGSWKQAAKILEDMLAQNPEHQSSIMPLLDDVRLKANINTRGTQGRSWLSLLVTRKRITYVLVALLVVVLVVGVRGVYTTVVVPARNLQLQRSLAESLIDQARTALSSANYAVAAELYTQALEKVPDSPEAEKGQRESHRQIELANSYDNALSLLAAGETEAALKAMKSLLSEAPGYRDVQRQIDQIYAQSTLGKLFLQAETAFQEQKWEDAIPVYVEVRQSNQGYEADMVDQHLYESYVALADQRSVISGQSAIEVDEIAQLYRLALSLRPKDRNSRLHEQMMNQYLQAGILMDVARYNEAIGLLDELYQIDPGMLGGDAVQLFYNARLAYGQQLEQSGSYFSALAQYAAAQDLPVADTSQAKLRALTVSLALTPTPTPTPEPTPTPTPDPFQDYLAALPPQPSPLEDFPGWIVFQSDRPYGSRYGLWVMSPDGSQQLPVDDPDGRYEFLKKQATWTNDNVRRIWVEDDGSGKSVALYMWRYDIPVNWLDARVELLNNSGINYQPALSPDNNAIAFTSQRTDGPLGSNYGDEIFILYFSEYNSSGYVTPHRLTKNDWEWDKHPTFSPDSKTVVFWSNRETGRAQIWATNTDGTNQRNLSNNEWNDWDPVYILPFRELPQLEKDGQLAPLFDPSKYTGNK